MSNMSYKIKLLICLLLLGMAYLFWHSNFMLSEVARLIVPTQGSFVLAIQTISLTMFLGDMVLLTIALLVSAHYVSKILKRGEKKDNWIRPKDSY
jgi:uncharacterized membrane protein